MNLLVTGAWPEASAQIPTLEAMGYRTVFLQQERDPLPCDPARIEGVVCNGLFLHHPIRDFSNLRLIQLTSAGFDRVDTDWIRANGIALYNARGVYSVPMAEFAVSGVLQLYKQAGFFLENRRRHRWEKHRGLLELCGRTVTLLGCGSVGTCCAERFRAFGCRVLGVDLFPRTDAAYERIWPLDRLDEVLAQTDILVLTLPLTPQTRGLVDGRRLGLLKPGALLVNISRGAVADEAAVVAALRAGTLAGAVLDVFETEPLDPDSPLWEMEQVILTPHNSFVSDRNNHRLTALILENLRKAAEAGRGEQEKDEIV